MLIRIGECTFDAVRREVRRGTRAVHLSPRAFDLLALLIARRPRALSKDELLGALWPDTFVTEANLAGLVAEIRREAGEDAREPRFLRTVHGFGYAFSDGTAPAADEDAVCRLVWGPREIPLAEGENLLGRDPAAAVSIDDATVSRHHARIVIDAGRARLEDLGSKNGTWLAERRIASSEALSDGDGIRVGPAALIFRSFAAAGPTATALE
ncbi:MAG TPA: FHA domain-containing protein [Thermoanaerobaculia bacterium]|jgi:DNA-binding winged helix-turn-helix (wHTH) protein|nr:FHA domain-containing protein [Thermoanaerobaculia bacterium]